MTRENVREQLLDEIALDAAHTWTRAYRLELAREGRHAAGGWPGTMAEARARALASAVRALSERAMPAPTNDELERITRATYREARRTWLQS